MFFHLFILCSAYVSALVILLGDSMCERIGKWKTVQFCKRTDRWCAFSRNMCDNNFHIISKVMSSYTNHVKATSVGKNHCGIVVVLNDNQVELVVEPGCRKMSGCGVRSPELWCCGSCASCPVVGHDRRPWRSEVLMTPKTDRSGLSLFADWLMWSLMIPGLELCLLYQAWWAELRLAVAVVSADWPVNWEAQMDWILSTV
jgi:hypothetical protein